MGQEEVDLGTDLLTGLLRGAVGVGVVLGEAAHAVSPWTTPDFS